MKKRALSSALLLSVLLIMQFAACTSSKSKPSAGMDRVASSLNNVGASTNTTAGLPDLADAMEKLKNAIEKPTSPFHISFKKSESSGLLYECEADVSSVGIIGQQTDHSPEVKVGTDVFPANTRVRKLSGTPNGSLNWSTVRGGIEMTYLSGHIGDAQEGAKYIGEGQSGGYNTRRYDFDLAGIDATIKKAMGVGNALGAGRQVKDFNIRGSAWIAKDAGQMVKFQYDTIYSFSNGETETIHYEGTVTKN
jgi:hypothetical protein